MIAFTCSACGKGLKAKEELAGRRIKCPGCGKAASIPSEAETSGAPRPAGDTEDKTLATKNVEARPSRTVMPGGDKGQATRIGAGDHDDDKSWDFLAPAGQPDEIGRLGPYRVLKVLGA